MFCDKSNVNILTAYMAACGIRHVVVCPGSRNAVLVHNFAVCDAFTCHAVTDERSGAFVALGMAASLSEPVAVCVTSGTALLNTLPAVAEAHYRGLPLLVISADRPQQWIGQQDGQTLPQPCALAPYATFSAQLHELTDEASRIWLCRLLNEAFLVLPHGPVHLNVPISEPLFSFTTPELPAVRPASCYVRTTKALLPDEVVERLKAARCPVLVVGQVDGLHVDDELRDLVSSGALLVLPEVLSGLPGSHRTKVLEEIGPESVFKPDLVLHVGGTFVNKRVKLYLRHTGADVVRIGQDRGLVDTFNHLAAVVPLTAGEGLHAIARAVNNMQEKKAVRMALDCLKGFQVVPRCFRPNRLNDLGVVQKAFEYMREYPGPLHLANSNSVRNALHFVDGYPYPVYCNRGTNGIEGSLSTAVGHALISDTPVYVFIGDLSFFYDQNALWNSELRGNLRILLLNNGGGQIFSTLPGLGASPAASKYVSATHHTSAQGIAHSYGVSYYSVRRNDELDTALAAWSRSSGARPVLLEAFTTPADNDAAAKVMHGIYERLMKKSSENASNLCE